MYHLLNLPSLLAKDTNQHYSETLRIKEVCERDLHSADINIEVWEDIASGRTTWRHAVKIGVGKAVLSEPPPTPCNEETEEEGINSMG